MLTVILVVFLWFVGFVGGLSIAVDAGTNESLKTRRRYFLMAVVWPPVFLYFALWVLSQIPRGIYKFLTEENY